MTGFASLMRPQIDGIGEHLVNSASSLAVNPYIATKNHMNTLRCLALACALSSSALAYYPTDFESPLTRIAFGSCNREFLPQPMWPVIADSKPELWIWMGDNVYGDSKDPAVVAEKYTLQFNQPNYSVFRGQFPIIGTWDDHDYGWNDADGSYPIKAQTRDMALEFMEVPASDPRWSREGLYGSYAFGPVGKRVRVILLDARYFSTKPKLEDSNLLGPEQEAWLEEILETSQAQVHLIVSGIQVLSAEHKYEKWANYPASREWLFDRLIEQQTPGVIFLSGDRHIHEINQLTVPDRSVAFTEVTSSGLTHSWERFKGEPNDKRIGEVYTGKGFGMLHFEWQESSVELLAEIRNIDNTTVNTFALTVPLADR